MTVIRGTAIIESIEGLMSAKKIFKIDEDELPILIVEGDDDFFTIQRYYYYRDRTLPFKVVKGDEVGGKKSAFNSYRVGKPYFDKVFCLTDKDFDPYLGEIQYGDPCVFYYDFYELENYLFDDSILRIFFMKSFNCTSKEIFEDIKKDFNNIKELYYPFSVLSFYRELNYREKLQNSFTESQKDKIVEVASKNPASILLNNSEKYIGLSLVDKIKKYIEEELNDINYSFGDIEKEIGEIAAGIVDTQEEYDLYYFKNLISGKFILGSLYIAIPHYVNNYRLLPNSQGLEKTLKEEWIPLYSEMFERLLSNIEEKI